MRCMRKQGGKLFSFPCPCLLPLNYNMMVNNIIVAFEDCQTRKCFELGQESISRSRVEFGEQPDLCCLYGFHYLLSDKRKQGIKKECN